MARRLDKRRNVKGYETIFSFPRGFRLGERIETRRKDSADLMGYKDIKMTPARQRVRIKYGQQWAVFQTNGQMLSPLVDQFVLRSVHKDRVKGLPLARGGTVTFFCGT